MSRSERQAELTVARAIAEQAVAWFVIHRERPLTVDERQVFLSWLQASPVHVREYLSVARMSLDLSAVAQTIDDTPEALIAAAQRESTANVVSLPPQSERESVRRWRPAVALVATVAAVAIGLISWVQLARMPQQADFRTAHGEQRTVRLQDGSVLHINSDSRVRVDFSKAARTVSMERGQALFKVAKDKARPFRVHAGDTEVIAVGTEFDVRRGVDDVLVTVVEGQVAVSAIATSPSSTLSMAVRAPLKLAAGQQARLAAGSVPQVRQAIDVRPAVAWVQQQIVFERETLHAVVEEFNRYGAMPMVIEDRDLAALRISGVFNAYDLESFVGYLEQVNGIAVHRDIDRVRLSITKEPITKEPTTREQGDRI